MHVGLNRCRSEAYNLAVFYPESEYFPLTTCIWQVCEQHMHAVLIASESASVGDFEIEDEVATDNFLGRADWNKLDKEKMLEEFSSERLEIQTIKEKNAQRFRTVIDAFGVVRDHNEYENLKGCGGVFSILAPEREIKLLWRDMYYRK